jgi:hypothetical protein
MYNLPHLLGVAGSHGPGSPRRGRARAGRRGDGSLCAGPRGRAGRLHVCIPVQTRGRTHRCAHVRTHVRAHSGAHERAHRSPATADDRRARWPQCSPLASLTVPIRCYGSRSPRLRARARLTPSKTIGLHHAPVAASMPSRSSFISTGASLVVALAVVLVVLVLVCRSSSPYPRTPALSVPRCPLCICLLSFLNPVLTAPNHSPKFSPWCGGVVGNWRRGIHGSTKPKLRRLSDASDERIGERIEQGPGGTCRRVSAVADAAKRWWPARGGRVSCATRGRSPP